MTQNNPDPAGTNPDPEKPRRPDQPGDPQAPAKPAKKKKRWLLKGLIAVVVLVVLVVLLAPTILSMGFVREIVVGKVNESAINGKLVIKDWSFGWFSGVHISGIELTDENNIHLLSVAQIDSPISLLKAATGTIDLGDATIKGVDFNAVIDEKGQINFARAIKPSNTPPSKEPSKLPNVKGTIHVQDVQGTLQDDAHKITVTLPQSTPLNVTVGITDINQPITDAIDVGLQVDQQNLALVKVNGTVSAIKNNLVDVPNLAADQTLELSQADLAAVTKVLHAMKLDLNVTGKLAGKIEAKVATLNNISADGGINIADVSASGNLLSGDTVAYHQVQLKLNAAVASPAIKLDLPITMTPTGSGQPDQINVHVNAPQDALMATADVFQAIASHLAKAPAGGVQKAQIAGTGDVKISVDMNVAGLVSQMPHALHLAKGMSLTSGQLTHETTITLANGQAVIASKTQLKDFGGTNAGQAVKLQDITASAGATAVGGDHPDVRDVQVNVASAFVSVQGGGPTLGKLQIKGSNDLKNVQQQFGQFFDLDAALHATPGSHVSLAGTNNFDVHTDGDLTADDSTVGVGADLTMSGVSINIPGRRGMEVPNLTATIGANLHHTAAQFVEAAKDVTVSVQSPAIQFAANGDAELGDKFGTSFAITQGKIDLRLVQEEFGGALSMFVAPPPAGQPETLVQKIADNSVRIASGSVTISGKGRFDQTGFGFEQPLAVTVQPTDLTVADEMGTVQTVHVPTVALSVSGNGSSDKQGVTTVRNLALVTTIGSSGTTLLDVEAGADFTISMAQSSDGGNMSAQRIELTKLDGDLPGLQSTLGPLLPLVVPAGPAGAKPSIVQMISQNLLVCSSGKLSGSMLASCDGKTMTIRKPLTVTISDLTLQQQNGSANSTPISHQTISTAVGGTVSMNPQVVHATISQLSVQLGDQLSLQSDPGAPIDVTMESGGKIAGSGNLQLKQADLPKLIAMGALVLPPEQVASLKQLSSGVASGTVGLKPDSSGNKVAADFSINSLTIGHALNNETVHLVAGATLAGDMSTVGDVNVGVDTSFAKKVAISNGQIVLALSQSGTLVPVGLFDMLRSVNVEVDQADLAKVDAILNILSAPPPPPPGAKVVLQVPPPVVTSGTASLKIDVSRSGNTTSAKISHVLVQGLAIKSNGSATAWPHDITADVAADVETAPSATADMPMMSQLAQAQVTSLSVDSGIGTTVSLADNKPIVATNLGDSSKMLVQGGVVIDGDIASAARVAETFGGLKANSYPYSGHFNLTETISKQASEPRLYVKGGGTITKFIVMSQPGANGPNSPPQQVFAEDNLSIKNPLIFDFNTFSVIIDKGDPIAVVLNSSGALGLNLSGTINDLPLRRQIADDNPVAMQISYDLAKLWPIIKPMLSPSSQQTLADLQISGKQTRSFVVSGSYPADKPFNDAVAMLKASGSVAVDSVSTNGVSVQNLEVPIYLANGVVQTVYADSGKIAQPATCNNGSLDIGGIALDLRSNLLSIPRASQQSPMYVMRDVTINPVMSKSIMGKILNNPAFVNAKQAQGLLTIRIVNANALELSNLSDGSPQNKGTAVAIYSVKGLRLGSELLAVFGNDSVSADINEANVKYALGRVAEDTTMMIDGNKPLRFAGTVVLATNQFAPMTVYIPASLFAKAVPGQYRQLVSDQTVVVPMKGDMTRPQIDLAQAIAETIKQGAPKAIINGLLQGLQHAR